MDQIEKIKVLRYDDSFEEIEDIIIVEFPFTIFFNGEELVTLLCSPMSLDYLAIGFLLSEGLINNLEDIGKLRIDDTKGIIYIETKNINSISKSLLGKRTITSGCGKGTTFYNVIDSIKTKKNSISVHITPHDIFQLTKEVDQLSILFRETGGVHGCALCNSTEVLSFHEDIGRHNAMDKVLGEALIKEIDIKDKIIVTTGRISSEMLLKAAKRQISIIISRSAPTHLSATLAKELGITLIGFVRGKRMNVYSESWRIKD